MQAAGSQRLVIRKNFWALAVAAVLGMGAASGAYAQATRTWVSGVGDDVNPCSRTAPCKTFAGAISKTAAGGEVSVLDPGGFGTVTINKSITIDGKGFVSGILSSGANGITINASSVKVELRNLEINGAGTGLNGLSILSNAAVLMDNVKISGVTQAAVSIKAADPITAANPLASTVIVQNSSFNGLQSGASGVSVETLGKVVLNNVQINGFTTAGVLVKAGANSQVMVQNSAITGSTLGLSNLDTTGTSAIYVSNSTLFGNTTAFDVPVQGNITSFNNNRLLGNGTTAAPDTSLPGKTVYER